MLTPTVVPATELIELYIGKVLSIANRNCSCRSSDIRPRNNTFCTGRILKRCFVCTGNIQYQSTVHVVKHSHSTEGQLDYRNRAEMLSRVSLGPADTSTAKLTAVQAPVTTQSVTDCPSQIWCHTQALLWAKMPASRSIWATIPATNSALPLHRPWYSAHSSWQVPSTQTDGELI